MTLHRNRILAGLGALVMCTTALASDPDHDGIAKRIVNQSLGVRPGEIVLIQGNPSEVALMGALQVAVVGAGGEVIVQLNIPSANKRAIMETSMEHLGRVNTSQLTLRRMVDAVINVTSIQDPELFADVPEERLAATRRGAGPLIESFNNTNVRSVTLGQTGGIPTAAYAKSIDADPKAITDMFWKAVAVDPDALAMTARKVSSMLQTNATARLTSASGTDITFAIDQVPARINAGRVADVQSARGASVWLPAGEAYTCLNGASASGTIVVPQMMFRGKPVTNLKLSYKDGELTNLTADSNEKMLKDYLAASDAQTTRLSAMSVGLNRDSQPLKGSQYRSWEMGGMVTVATGNNAWAGGDNHADGALSMHLQGATLKVGNASVVSNGELVRLR